MTQDRIQKDDAVVKSLISTRPEMLARWVGILMIILCLHTGCHTKTSGPPLFELVPDTETGLHFSNQLTPTQQFNIFKYLYFYNGAGIGAGDFNNDGKIDLFFAANQQPNRLYLNKGNLQFSDVTTEAQILNDGGWSTGVSVVDINNDGLLDIYICRVGNYETLHSRNQFLICQEIDKNGVPLYKDEAKKYGLDFSGFCTQAAFFDYDDDGDLDMYLLNHSVHQNGTFGIREKLLKITSPLSGDRIFRNDGNQTFTEVTHLTGIHSSVLGYGLGICVSDIDLDGYPDIYVGNDFHENDYLYINQRNGTFREELTEKMMHTSQFSMGVDVADLDNDGYSDIISMDMLPSDPLILKSSLGEDEYDLFYNKLQYGYNYQYTRNNLQWNRRNGLFSEIGLYAGVYATDWSWAPLLMDFDNDGLKDLFVSNGISKRLNDIDYINYVSDAAVQMKMRTDRLGSSDMTLINKFPQTKIPNRFFRNRGDMSFDDVADAIEGNVSSYSNGAIYADLDDDGDLDVVVNNIDHPAFLYKNTSINNDRPNQKKPYLDIKLKGAPENINAIGARVVLFANGGIRTYENYPVKGFMSSMQTPLHIGLDKTKADSILLIWPDRTYEKITNNKADSQISLTWKKDLPTFDYSTVTSHWKNSGRQMEDITRETGVDYVHKENLFQEFNREPLIPRMFSTEGPALAVGDINHDGLEDVFIGASKWEKPVVYLQQPSGKFLRREQSDLDKDSTYEDVSAVFADVNADGALDLVVASGGDEFYGTDQYLMPRIYLNDGNGTFHRLADAFKNLFINASVVAPFDFNQDGKGDLFIGGRSVPWSYGQVPQSYLLQNDGTGRFSDVTAKLAPELGKVGFVTSGQWYDINRDGKSDLILTLEWGGIVAFINDGAGFHKKFLTDKRGWWNFVLPADLNNDGNTDLIAGNLGLNSRLRSSPQKPVRLYYNDFDGNGKREQILTYYLDGKEIQFADKGELEKQIPIIKKKYLYAKDFTRASLEDIFTREKLRKADTLTANYFPNAILLNDGDLRFSVHDMPWQAQLSPYRDAAIVDANGDQLADILLVGNFYENNIQMGRYDADYGTILINNGKGRFSAESINGLAIKGQVRHIQKIKIGRQNAFILVRNNDAAMVIKFK